MIPDDELAAMRRMCSLEIMTLFTPSEVRPLLDEIDRLKAELAEKTGLLDSYYNGLLEAKRPPFKSHYDADMTIKFDA